MYCHRLNIRTQNMNQPEDDYAALHSYIQLMEIEIDQVINGGFSLDGSEQREARSSCNNSSRRPPTLALQKNPEATFVGTSSKPPRGSRRDQRINKKRTDDLERENAVLPFRKGERKNILEVYNSTKQGLVRSECAVSNVGDKFRSSSPEGIIETGDLCVIEDIECHDELLQNILSTKENNELLESDVSSEEEGNLWWDASINTTPFTSKIKKRSTDLQKLLDTDRDSLILGPGVRAREKYCDHCLDRRSGCSQTIHQCDHHQHHHKHHHHHHRCASEPEICPVLHLDHMLAWRQSFQPCHCHHQYHHRHQRGCQHCSMSDNDLFVGIPRRKSYDLVDHLRRRKSSDSSGDLHSRKVYSSLNGECCMMKSYDPLDRRQRRTFNDPLDELRTAKSFNALDTPYTTKCSDPLCDLDTRKCSHPLEKLYIVESSDLINLDCTEKGSHLLTKIHKNVQRVNTASLHPPHRTQHIAPMYLPSIPPPSSPLQTVGNCSELTSPQSDLEIFEDEKDQDVSTSDRSYTDSELRDIFDCPPNKLTSGDNRHKPSRNSYPNDSLIISPPPGFGSPDSEEEMWVKVRLVTRSQDDLSCRTDEHGTAERNNFVIQASECKNYSKPFDFDGNPQLSTINAHKSSDLYTPCDFSVVKEKHKAVAKEDLSNIHITAPQHSASDPSESETRILPSETRRSGKSHIKDISSVKDQREASQEAQGFNLDTSKTLIAPDAAVTSSDLAIDESTLGIPADILGTASGLESYSNSSATSTNQSSHRDSQNKGHRHSAVRHQNIQTNFPVTNETKSRLGHTGTGIVVTPKRLDSTVNSKLLPKLEEDRSNNTSNNLLSMCIASDCKLLKSCRSPRVPQSHVKLQSGSQTFESHHERVADMLAPESCNSSQNPSKSVTRISNSPRAPSYQSDKATDAQFQLQNNSQSEGRSSGAGSSNVSPQSTAEKHSKGTGTKEPLCLDEKHAKSECSVGKFVPVDTSDDCFIKKVTLKDTSVQTSLELDGFVVDITETLTSHTGVTREAIQDIDISVDQDKCDSDISCDSLQCEIQHGEINKACAKEGKLHFKNEHLEANNVGVVFEDLNAKDTCNTTSDVVTRTPDTRTPFRASLLRSKSVHESQIDVGDTKNKQRPDASCLSGNLRELSHLNIDVSQRLIGGEQRFIVTNGSPELQVVVNALTPVLTRRSRARNPRRIQNLDSVTEAPRSLKSLTGTGPASATTEPTDVNLATNLNARSSSFEKSMNQLESNHATKALPVYARLRSYEGPKDNTVEKSIVDMQEDLMGGHGSSSKERRYNRISRSSSARASNATRNNTMAEHGDDTTRHKRMFRCASARRSNAARNKNTTAGHCEDNVDEELIEELEESKTSLFLSPKLSHTWHGSSASSSHRSASGMGVDRTFGDDLKYECRADGSIGPVALAPKHHTSSSQADQHSHTMPVISRTLLDALHKRYCAYQYSNHYQTMQQFSLLKLDSTIASGNHAVTALLVEPLHARGHEVQAAPPSPEILARLRMLKNAIASNTDKHDTRPRMHSASNTDKHDTRPRMHSASNTDKHDTRPRMHSASNTETHDIQPRMHSADREQTSFPLSQPRAFEDFLFEQSRLEFTKSSEETQLQNILYMTHDSSPELQDKLNHGNKHTELEAAEALKWLRAAGFPQYAQMFDDGQFPVDMGIVERDHDFLDKDSLQSLFRRLETLNKYAGIKRDSHPCKKTASEEEDEDDCCALSERWEYQKSARRWSRKDLSSPSQKTTPTLKDQDLAVRSGSHDSLLADQDSESQIGDSPLLAARSSHQGGVLEAKFPHQSVGQSPGTSDMVSVSHRGLAAAEVTPENSDQTGSPMSPRLRRATSEKMKTAKNIFKKMEGMKSSKSRRQSGHRTIVEISGPVVADKEHMQAKLDKLNCVDILQDADAQLSPPLMRGVNVSEHSDRTDSHHLSSHTHVAPASPQSPSSPRPRSDFLLRSKEGMSHVPLHPVTQARPSSVSPNQRPSVPHDTSFEEYHQAQATFLQNLQSSHRSTAESVRKNNSETNLMEIFLVPQDHQPGRFPRVLQNGYIETEACGTGVNVRTGSVRLCRSSCMKSDNSSPGLRSAQLSEANSPSYRLSMYDNCSPSEGKISEGGETSSVIPSAFDVGGSRESKQSPGHLFRESTEVDKQGFIHEGNSASSPQDSRDTSRESSVVRTAWSFSEQQLRNSDHERSVSFESSTSSQSPDDSTLVNVEELTSTDSKNSRVSSSDSFSSKSKVTHSSSLDSYFKGSSSQNETPVSDSFKAIPPANTFQENYDEFDRILQELYKNINDLTTFMDRDKSASPRSPQDSSGPLDFYGALELDHENSSSGGEGSNTAESGSEDQEMALTDVSQDDSLDQITEVSRERRDSGVGHSLTRAPSDRRRKKIRWHSFQKSHRPDISSRAMQINSLTICQLVRLQKLSLLRLTGIMEKCLPVNKSGWNWMVPRFMKRHKAPDFSDKNVFGVPLSVMAQRTGQPLPQCVLYAMRYLRRTCPSAVGIFRKSGVKSKIQQLRDYLEAHPDTTNFDGENAYNVADMLKTYFRDLPECLLTNKMSETFRSIYTYVPQSQRLDAIQAAILLLPDENREVLQSLLLFLSDISEHEADHQMNASNLAVCFTPTVFHLGPRQSVPYSPKRNRKNSSGMPDPREILEQRAAHECLLMMITDCKKLFTVPSNLFRQLQVQSMAHVEPSLLQDIGSCPSDVRAFGQERIQIVLKESHDKNRGWVPTMTIGDVEVFHRKPLDDCLLKEWKLVVDIEAPPVEVLRRIMHERHTWDEDLLSWSVVERLDAHSDIFQFVLNSMAPHPPRNFCELRYWRSDLNKGACALITMSVEHSDSLEIHGVWAIDLGTYFLMEPCGSGRSRLTYLTRVDTRGRMPEWYTKIFGHICANFLDRLKESFKQDTSGPETKV